MDEVPLRVELRLLAEDLDGALVGADRAVGTEPVEDGAADVVGLDVPALVEDQGRATDVVADADGEVPARSRAPELVEHGAGHGRRVLLRGQAIAPADHGRPAARPL